MQRTRDVVWALAMGLATLAPSAVLAHGGRTDSTGCHNETATGTRHCHSGGSGDGGSSDSWEPSEGYDGYSSPPAVEAPLFEDSMDEDEWERAEQERADQEAMEADRERMRQEAEALRRERSPSGGGAVEDSMTTTPFYTEPSREGAMAPVPARRAPVNRPTDALAAEGPAGGMEGGLRDLVNTKVGEGACTMVENYAVLSEGEGFRVSCSNDEVRFEITSTGRGSVVAMCTRGVSAEEAC